MIANESVDNRSVSNPLYARSGIREAWLVNLVDGVVEVHRDPTPQGNRLVRRAGPAEMISPEAFPEVEMSVAEILGE